MYYRLKWIVLLFVLLCSLSGFTQTIFYHNTQPRSTFKLNKNQNIVIELNDSAQQLYNMSDQDGKFVYGKFQFTKNNTLFLNNNREIKYSNINSILIKNPGYYIKTSLVVLGYLSTGIFAYVILSEEPINFYAFILPFNYLMLPAIVGHASLDRNLKLAEDWHIAEYDTTK